MATSGFRLFVVSLHDNQMAEEQSFTSAQARTPPKSKKPDAVHFFDAVAEDVRIKTGKSFNQGVGQTIDEEEVSEVSERVGTSTRLLHSARSGSALHLKFYSGPILTGGLLSDPFGDEADTPMVGRSTLHDFRACLTVKAGGKRAILAVETRGNSCPVRPLIWSLKRASDLPWRLKLHEAAADAAALAAFIDNGRVVDAELTQWTFDKDGHRVSREKALVSKVSLVDQAKAKMRILSWRQEGRRTDKQVWQTEAAAVKSEFYTQKIDITFNDTAFTVENGEQQRKFSPATNFNRFTYRLDDRERVGDEDFFTAVEEASEALIENVQGTNPDLVSSSDGG